MPPERPPLVRPWPAALLSLIIPGSGQFILGHRSRGIGLFLTFCLLLALVLWTGTYALLAPLLLFLGWIARDAYQLAQGKPPRWGVALLLADEPVASLDPVLSHSILRYLELLNQQDRITVLCSLHFLDLVHRYATRVVGLKAGELVFDGLPSELTPAKFKEVYGEEAEMVSVAPPHAA